MGLVPQDGQRTDCYDDQTHCEEHHPQKDRSASQARTPVRHGDNCPPGIASPSGECGRAPGQNAPDADHDAEDDTIGVGRDGGAGRREASRRRGTIPTEAHDDRPISHHEASEELSELTNESIARTAGDFGTRAGVRPSSSA